MGCSPHRKWHASCALRRVATIWPTGRSADVGVAVSSIGSSPCGIILPAASAVAVPAISTGRALWNNFARRVRRSRARYSTGRGKSWICNPLPRREAHRLPSGIGTGIPRGKARPTPRGLPGWGTKARRRTANSVQATPKAFGVAQAFRNRGNPCGRYGVLPCQTFRNPALARPVK